MNTPMRAATTLPANYQEAGTIDITKDQRLMLILNIVGIVGLIVFGSLFFLAITWLRPSDLGESMKTIGFQIDSLSDLLVLVAAVLVLTAFHVILHEAIHGIFFWIFTRSRPVFAFRWIYAYAAAPGWYLPRGQFLVTTLAPLVAITLLGLLAFRYAPPGWLLAIWYIVTMNAAGAVGDIMVAGWLLINPPSSVVQDRGDAVTLYKQKNA